MRSQDSAGFSFKEKLFLFFVLLLLPGIILKEAAEYIDKEKQSVVLAKLTSQLHKPLDELKVFGTADLFWCSTLTEMHRNAKNANEFKENLEKLIKLAGVKAEYVIQKPQKKQFFSNFAESEKADKWKKFFEDIELARTGENLQVRKKAELRVKKIIGLHYLGEFAWMPVEQSSAALIRGYRRNPDSNIWLTRSSRCDVIVFLKKKHLHEDLWLRLFKNRWKNFEQNLLILNSNQKKIAINQVEKLVWAAVKKIQGSDLRQIQLEGFLIAAVQIAPELFVANYLRVPEDSFNSVKKGFLLFFMAILIFVLLARTGFFNLSPGNISVRYQLMFMLFISSGLPFMVLLLVGLEHLSEKEKFLVEEAYQRCVNYIQDIDRRSQIENSQVILKSEKCLSKFRSLIDSGSKPEDVFAQVYEELHPSRSDLRIIASSGELLLSRIGILSNGKFKTHDTDYSGLVSQSEKQSLKIINDLGSYYLSFYNRAENDQKRFTEIEILSEMFYQKSMVEIMNDFVSIDGKVSYLGWGSVGFPVYKKDISISDANMNKDFMVFIPHSPISISRHFFERQSENLRRNPLGLKIIFADNAHVYPGGAKINRVPGMAQLLAKLGSNPSNNPQLVEFENETWIYAGYDAQFLERFRIVAMLPLKSIVSEVNRDKDFLKYSGLLVILLISGVAMLFGHSFIFPLKQLEAAAIALEKKTFGISLPPMGNDEFGEMANIFNKSIAELEELSLASIVQGRLMPEHQIDSGNIALYGRSISMTDLGGDYFDYFNVDDDHFAVLIGDVAGHGVGSSLIMAMAKAAVICSDNYLKEPSVLLQRLHLMICATRSRSQRKIMTFQYLLFNKKTGAGKYANAGGCSPIRVSSAGSSAEEISLPAPVLGGFKKSKFDESELFMEIGDAVVLYTDGIVEAKNSAGEELGYDGLKKMLQKCYCRSAKDYYDAVLAGYNEWLGAEGAQDDLTMIFLVFHGDQNQ